MKLMSFNFEKINIEKQLKNLEKLNIKSNIDFMEIKEVKSEFKFKGEMLSVKFKYDIFYEPDFAKINFIGNILLSLDPKKAKTLIKEYKNKKISDEFKVPLFNFILRKCNIKALQLEDEIGIPIHIKLPYVEKTEEQG